MTTKTIPEVERLLYTTEEAATSLGIGVTKTKELMASGELRSVRIGRARRVPLSSLKEFIQILALAEAIFPQDNGE